MADKGMNKLLQAQNKTIYDPARNPDFHEREIIREQDFPKEIFTLLQNHDHHFDPLTQFEMAIGLKFSESEAVLFGNLNSDEIMYVNSMVSMIMSTEKMSLPRSVTEKPEYWDTRAWQGVFNFIKHTRMRGGAEMYHSTVRREELTVDDKRNQQPSMLEQVGDTAKGSPLSNIPASFRGSMDSVRKR